MSIVQAGPEAISEQSERPEDVSPERIAETVANLTKSLDRSLKHINDINRQARLLSLNARIEASRASGDGGAAFGVVAQAMSELSVQTDRVATELGERSRESISRLELMNRLLATNFRGIRLSDVALTNIDLIDRNLYERSCDVRWWATDNSVVDALTSRTNEDYQHASRRLGVILDSYTVYFDLVLCDTRGVVVANGRPGRYVSVGSNQAHSAWFQSAIESQSGAEFGFQSVHESQLANRQRVLVYSCAVREGGDVNGKPIGVLGIIFNWDALAQTIVENVPLAAHEKERTRVCITDDQGLILADSSGRQLKEVLVIPNRELLCREAKNFVIAELGMQQCCVAHARAPGFETYTTGWHSFLIYEC